MLCPGFIGPCVLIYPFSESPLQGKLLKVWPHHSFPQLAGIQAFPAVPLCPQMVIIHVQTEQQNGQEIKTEQQHAPEWSSDLSLALCVGEVTCGPLTLWLLLF